MNVTQAAIKRLIETGCARDVSNDPNLARRPFNSTIVFHSFGRNGLNGLVLRIDDNGELLAVVGRCNNLFMLAR